MKYETRESTNYFYLERINLLTKKLISLVCLCRDATKLYHHLDELLKIQADVNYYKQYLVNPTFGEVIKNGQFLGMNGILFHKTSENTADGLYDYNATPPFDTELWRNLKISPDQEIASPTYVIKSYLILPPEEKNQ